MKEKRRLRKGVLSFSLAVFMIIGTLTGIVPGTSIKAKAETATGVWSSGIDYSYDTATGVLTLTGNGSTTVASSTVVYNERSYPPTINEPFSNISRIVISEGITSIGDYAFANWNYVFDFRNNLTIEIPSTVTSIGNWAFSSITNGSVSVIMNARPGNITTFYTNAFNNSKNGEFITPYASEWKESNKCSYDSTNNRITFDNIYKGIFTLSGVTYTVTYKVINGTWSDDSTTDKTETVQSGSKPASVPTGMKAASGYTGGAWDTDPADATITEAKTFTYTFTAIPTYEVTYKVVGGTWSDGSTTDKQETVQNGAKPASVPTGMKASEGYTGGAWDTDPASATITGTKTFTYTFTAKQAATVTKAPEAKTLTYTGSAQELVTAGTASGGTMQYAIGENSTTAPADNLYTTSIPSKTDAGTYYVWYKVVGDADHADSAAAYVTVTIGKAAGGGSSGGSSGSTITVPVSGDSASVSVSASVSGATATVKAPTTAQLDKVIGESVKTGEVTIDVSGLNRNIATVSIPTETVKAIEKAVNDPDNDADALTVKLTDGSVTFDAKALAAVVDQAKGSTIQLNLDNIGESKLKSAQKTAIKDMDVQAVYDAYMTSNGQRISDFKGGKAAVTVSYTLKDGQTGRGVVVWYVADDGKTTEVPTAYNDKTVSFTVEHFSNYVIAYDEARAVVCPQDNTCPISAFSDASATAWYHDGVHYVLESGIMNGVGNGKFGPGNATSRAMIAQILWNMEGKPIVNYAMRYTDVDADAWYAEAVRWATAQGIMSGYGYNKFGPNDDMTREQLVTIMYRYAQYKGVDVSVGEDTNILSYDDALTVSEFAIPAMQWAVGSGAVSGRTNTTLNPKDTATRAEIATIIMRYCEEIAK